MPQLGEPLGKLWVCGSPVVKNLRPGWCKDPRFASLYLVPKRHYMETWKLVSSTWGERDVLGMCICCLCVSQCGTAWIECLDQHQRPALENSHPQPPITLWVNSSEKMPLGGCQGLRQPLRCYDPQIPVPWYLLCVWSSCLEYGLDMWLASDKWNTAKMIKTHSDIGL